MSLLARLKSIEEPELETAELRRQMASTGITAYLENDLPDIELESSESLLARLKSIEESEFGTPMPTRALTDDDSPPSSWPGRPPRWWPVS